MLFYEAKKSWKDSSTFNSLSRSIPSSPQADPGNYTDARQPKDWTIMQFIKQANLGRFEMFNLKTDPSETTNLTRTQPERFSRLKKRMIALHAEIRAEGPEYELGKTK